MTADWGYENTKIDHLHYDFIRAKTSGSCSRPTKTGPCEPKKHGPYLAMVVLPKYSDLKPATHGDFICRIAAIGENRQVCPIAIAIFADRWYRGIKSPIFNISDIGD